MEQVTRKGAKTAQSEEKQQKQARRNSRGPVLRGTIMPPLGRCLVAQFYLILPRCFCSRVTWGFFHAIFRVVQLRFQGIKTPLKKIKLGLYLINFGFKHRDLKLFLSIYKFSPLSLPLYFSLVFICSCYDYVSLDCIQCNAQFSLSIHVLLGRQI